MNQLEVVRVGRGVSHIPAGFQGRVLCYCKPLKPERDEREFPSIVGLHSNDGAELCGDGRSSSFDLLDHGDERGSIGVVKASCSQVRLNSGRVL